MVICKSLYRNSDMTKGQSMRRIQPIICLETGEKYESVDKCAKTIGVHRSSLYSALKKGHAAHGLHYYYAEKPKPPKEFFDHPVRQQPVRVRCIETGEVFESIRKAMEMTGVSRRAIYHAITNEAGGLHWEAVDDERTFF